MIVVFLILFIFLIVLWSKMDFKEKKKILVTMLIILIWNLFWLILVQAELLYKGVYTYGSDANYYYTEMIKALNSDRPFYTAFHSRLAPLYVLFGTFVLKTSPNFSSVWIKLSNVLIIEATFILIYLWMRDYVNNKGILSEVILFFGVNGIITWTVLRELKDILFVFLVIVNMAILQYLLERKKSLQAVIFTGVMSVIFYYLRMFAVALPIIILLTYILVYRRKVERSLYYWFIFVAGLALIIERKLLVWFYNGFIYYSGRFREPLSIVKNGSFVLQLLLAPFRFLIGPGPIRSLAGSDIFVVTTNVGNILIFLGSLFWWLILPFLFILFFSDLKFVFKNLYLLVPPVFITLIYSFMYLGTGDTRLRATTYLLFIPVFCKYFEYLMENKTKKAILAEYILFSLIVWSLGIIISVWTVS